MIDYTQNDYLSEGALYDIIADAVGALTFRKIEPVLAENGRYLAINAGLGDMFARRRGTRRCVAAQRRRRRPICRRSPTWRWRESSRH